MSVSGIQGQLLEITVVGCNKLKNTEWILRQDPYVCLDYASSKHRTRTCHGGGKNPTIQEKLEITLIEGLLDINITVWNSNKMTFDDFIGNGKVLLQGVLCKGFDDSCWPLQDRKGRNAGEVRLVMHYANAKKFTTTYGSAAPPYAATPPHPALYSAPPLVSSHPPLTANYPPPVPPPYPQPLYHHQPSPLHPAYQALPSYSQQPAYPPAPPSYPQQPAYPPAPPSYTQQPAYPPAPPSYPQQPSYPPAPPSYPQQPAYPPAPPNPQYYYPQGTYPPPPHPRHHMF